VAGDEFEELTGSLPRAEHEATDRRLAERLDAMETERVMRRAMELEEATPDATESFSPEDLERIAVELGINREFVRQAIAEVRSEGGERTKLEVLLLPEETIAQATLTGMSRKQADRLVSRWMTEYEGLIPVGKVRDGLEWEVDQSAITRMRTALTSGANRMSRKVPGPVQHRIASISEDEHVVTFSASDANPMWLAKLGPVAGVVIGATMGVGGLVETDLGLMVSGAFFGTGMVGGSILGARKWASDMKQALRKSLTGLSSQRTPTEAWSFRRKKKRS